MDAPSMVQRAGDTFIVRSVVSGNQLFVSEDEGHKKESRQQNHSSNLDLSDDGEDGDSTDLVINEEGEESTKQSPSQQATSPLNLLPNQLTGEDILNFQRTWLNQIQALNAGGNPELKEQDLKVISDVLRLQSQLMQNNNNNNNNNTMPNRNTNQEMYEEEETSNSKKESTKNLPQCKIKRNYSCCKCSYFTQNPRLFLTHLRDIHGEKLLIHACKLCVYASRHYQKLVRHMKMVHGQTVEQDGSHLSIRKRATTTSQMQNANNNSVNLVKRSAKGEDMSSNSKLLALMGVAGSGLLTEDSVIPPVSCSNSSASSDHGGFEGGNQDSTGQNLSMGTLKKKRMMMMIGNSHSSSTGSYSSAINNNTTTTNNNNKTATTTTSSTITNNNNTCNKNTVGDLEGGLMRLPLLLPPPPPPPHHTPLRNNHHNKPSNCNSNQRVSSDYLEIDNRDNNDVGHDIDDYDDMGDDVDNIENDDDVDDNDEIDDMDDDIEMMMLNRYAATAGNQNGDPNNNSTTQHNNNNNNFISNNNYNNPEQEHTTTLVAHLENQNHHHDSDRFPLKCGMCQFETPSRRLMVEHEARKHPQSKTFRCVKCNYVTHMKARYSKHVKYHSMPMTKCNLCDFRTPYKWNLDRHMKNHGGNGPFKCAACNFTADIKQSLTVHEMNHHVPPVGHASGMTPLGYQQRRRNKVGGTDAAAAGELQITTAATGSSGAAAAPSADMELNAQLLNLATNINLPLMLEAAGLLGDVKNDSSNMKKAPRPIPNLIPIQGPPASTSPNSALNLSSKSGADKSKTGSNTDLSLNEDDNSNPSSHNNISIFKKKNESFFDKLKEKLVTNSGNGSDNLVCVCNHQSKCLSEAIIHQNNCQKYKLNKTLSLSPTNLTINKNSTRCQFCRHRCKSSADLIQHMQRCSQASNLLSGMQMDSADSMSEMGNSDKLDEDNEDTENEKAEPHPMENRIFVWNNMHDQQDTNDQGSQDQFPVVNIKLERRSEEPELNIHDQFKSNQMNEFSEMPKRSDHSGNTTLKKVFKCPHCSFWASTASRFHVHIVGHLNKKPFECSLCSYRSNWRWDITKHIRLKTIRDPSHKTARVLMNDETGRRNYTKYNKYITLMKVSEEDGNLKLMKSGEMTPNQEANLTSPHNASTGMGSSNHSSNHSTNNVGNSANYLLMQSLKHFTDGKSLSQNIQDLSVRSSLSDSNNIDIEPIISHATGIPQLMIQTDRPSHETSSILLGKLNSMDTSGENKKQTSYQCKKCQFKHPNRSVVLEHVNGHYRDAGVMAKPAPSSSQQMPIEITPVFSNNLISPNNSANLLTASSAAISGMLPASAYLTNLNQVTVGTRISGPTTTTVSHSLGMAGNHNSGGNHAKHNSIANKQSGEHGEMDEASSGGTSGGHPGWRSAAPYRCGHCHQVSNWKHVIQRHCRLKHNGNIKIELIGKEGRGANKNLGNNKRQQQAAQQQQQQLQIPPQQQYQPLIQILPPPVPSTSSIILPAPLLTTPQTSLTQRSAQNQSNLAEMLEVRQKFNSIINQFGQEPNKPALAAAKKKQYQCAYCLYHTDNKSQFTYHKSLHNAERMDQEFQCKYCSYVASKKHLLDQHMKIHQQNSSKDDVIVVESENHSVFPKKGAAEDEEVSEGSSMEGDLHDLMVMQIEEGEEMNVAKKRTSENKENLLRLAEKKGRNEFFCPHCPFKDATPDVVNDHKKFHSIVTNKRLQFNCEFCDFTSNIEQLVKDHRKLHFAPLKDVHKVEFCTTYDKLKLFVTATTATGAGSPKNDDQKIYDEDEIDEETSWINQFKQKNTNGTSPSSKNAPSTSSKVLVNSINSRSLKRNTSNNETSDILLWQNISKMDEL